MKHIYLYVHTAQRNYICFYLGRRPIFSHCLLVSQLDFTSCEGITAPEVKGPLCNLFSQNYINYAG